MGKDLEPLAVKAEGFSMIQERGAKWGYIAEKAGATLVLQLDTTFDGQLNSTQQNSPPLAAGSNKLIGRKNSTRLWELYYDASGNVVEVQKGIGEVSFAFLKSYENIGSAQVGIL